VSAYGGYAELQKGHGRQASVLGAVWTRRTRYLAGAVCLALCAFAIVPIVMTVLGLPTYILNSLGTAALAIGLALLITIPAGYALARYPIPYKEVLFVFLLLGLIIPYQALLTPYSCFSRT